MDKQPLKGLRTLIIEDDYLLAMAMQQMIEDAGGHVVGAIGWLDEALDFIDGDEADFQVAILDMNLHGAKTYPLADRLIAQGRKFLFITGYGANAVDPAYHAHPRYEKPCKAATLVAALSLLKEKRPS